MLQKINRGDVYFYNFGFDYDGSVEGKNRPCVIVSNDKGNNFGTTALVAPITTRSKDSCKPWQVHFQNGTKSQIILCEQVKTVNIAKLYNYQGKLDALTMRAVDEALAVEFDLNVTQREQDSTEFLHRLDVAIVKVVNSHLNNYDKKINETISNALANANSCKTEYEELCNKVINKVTEIVSNNTDVLTGINEIKTVFNQNAENIDKILASLINLYKDMSSKSEVINVRKPVTDVTIKEIQEQDTEAISKITNDSVSDTINETEVKSKRPRYTVDFAKEFIKNYYNMNRQSFMDKYNLTDSVTINNKLTTMKNLLKRNGIDWKNIKDNITVYNINDLSEEEKQAKFAKYLKKNETLAVVNKSENIEVEEKSEISETNETDNEKTNNGRNQNWQPRINYENVQELLDFIDECNKNSVKYICDKYNLTPKQLSNRKYLISKSLKERNIPFTMIKKSRKDVK